MARGKSFDATNIILVAIVAVVFLFLFGRFVTTDTAGDLTFNEEANFGETGLLAFELLVIGLAVFAGYGLVKKFTGGAMSQRDAFALILIAIALYFLWDYAISKIFDAVPLSEIAIKTAQKLGFLTP